MQWILRTRLAHGMALLSSVDMGNCWSIDRPQNSVRVFSSGSCFVRVRSWGLVSIHFWFIGHLFPYQHLGVIWAPLGDTSWRCNWCVNPLSSFLRRISCSMCICNLEFLVVELLSLVGLIWKLSLVIGDFECISDIVQCFRCDHSLWRV